MLEEADGVCMPPHTSLKLEVFIESLPPHLLALCPPFASKQTQSESVIPNSVIWSPSPIFEQPLFRVCLRLRPELKTKLDPLRR